MGHLRYNFKMALKPTVKNIISVLSLALGLALILVLFGNVLHHNSYDNYHENKDRFYFLKPHYVTEGEGSTVKDFLPHVVPAALMAEMSEIECKIEYSSRTIEYKFGDDKITMSGLWADASLFDMFSYEVIKGNPNEDFKDRNIVYLSESKALELFGDLDPIGQILVKKNGVAHTVKGIYKVLDRNSIMGKPSYIEPIDQYMKVGESWYMGYRGSLSSSAVLLREGVSKEEAEAKIEQIVDKHYDPVKAASENRIVKYKLSLVRDEYRADDDIASIILITFFMILLLVVVTALNYSLISISSLASRQKEFAVHKCNGASSLRVVWMIFVQTSFQTLFALSLAVLVIIAFQDQISLFLTPIDRIFSKENLYGCALMVLFIIVISAIIPSRIFANISVMALFRGSRNSHQSWKKIMLLFMFFLSITTIILVGMVYKQYDFMLNKDLGYNYENLVYSRGVRVREDMGMYKYIDELKKLDCVEDAAFSDLFLMNGVQKIMGIMKDGEVLFSSTFISTSVNYFDVHEMDILDGKVYVDGKGLYSDVVVNEKFVEMMNWDRDKSAVGNTFEINHAPFTVIGVVSNFQCAGSDLSHANYMPVIMFSLTNIMAGNYDINIDMTIKLRDITPQNISAVKDALRELDPITEANISTYRQEQLFQFEIISKPLRGVALSGIIMFLITIIGLYGYISNELQYKHREIALRKVYGASVSSIIMMIYRPIFIVLSIAIPLGIIVSYFGGTILLERSLPYVVSMPWWIFVSVPLFILLFTYGIVAARTFKIASENPIKAIHE